LYDPNKYFIYSILFIFNEYFSLPISLSFLCLLGITCFQYRHRTLSSAASKIGERQRDDFASPLQRLLCADEKKTTKQNRPIFLIHSKPMQNKTKAKLQQHSVKQRVRTFAEAKPKQFLTD